MKLHKLHYSEDIDGRGLWSWWVFEPDPTPWPRRGVPGVANIFTLRGKKWVKYGTTRVSIARSDTPLWAKDFDGATRKIDVHMDTVYDQKREDYVRVPQEIIRKAHRDFVLTS